MDLYKYTIVLKQNDILYLIKRTDRQPERERKREIETDLKANVVIQI